MPITADWDNPEKTIYRYTMSGAWTMDEFMVQDERLKQHMAEVPHPVSMILDIHRATLMSTNVIEAGQVVFAVPIPNLRLTVIISRNRAWQVLGQGMTQIFRRLKPDYPTTFVWVRSDKEAYAAIDCFRNQQLPPDDI